MAGPALPLEGLARKTLQHRQHIGVTLKIEVSPEKNNSPDFTGCASVTCFCANGTRAPTTRSTV